MNKVNLKQLAQKSEKISFAKMTKLAGGMTETVDPRDDLFGWLEITRG